MDTRTTDTVTDEAPASTPVLEQAKQALAGLWRVVRRFWIPIAILAVLVIGANMIFGGKPAGEPYRTAAIDTGEITRVVSATGKLEPVVSANIGSTVSGPVKDVLVDFNTRVTAGQVLARLDPTTFQQRVTQLQASLAQAQAQAAVANADYQRYELLQQRGFASEQLMSQQRAARDTARASVAQAAAQLAQARTDLDRTVIRSPINGTVVDRQVTPGQSVAASFQAATLFIIAQDLSRLQANITVDEADIGDVQQGMPVRFTVDAFPDAEFEGVVSQVRQQGAETQGVVSYTVVVQADNPGNRLLPGMTANAEIIIERTESTLRLPNTALRFRPTDPELQAEGTRLASQFQNQGRGQRGAAQQAGAPQGDAAQQGGGRGQRGGQGGGSQRMVAQIAQQLELTPAQQTQLQQAFQQGFQSMPRPQEGAEGGGGDRRAAMRRMRDNALRAIEPTLTPRQRDLLAQMRAAPPAGPGARRVVERHAVAWVLRNNKPTPVHVVLGVADETNTAIVGGDLKQGDEVIVGGGPRDTRQQQNRGPNPLGGGQVRVRGG